MEKHILLLFGDKIQIRNIEEGDKQAFRDLHYSRSALQSFFDDMILGEAWESQRADGVLTGAVVGRDDDTVYGFCQIREMKSDEPEILVQISDDWSDRGFGSEAAGLLSDYAFSSLGAKSLVCETGRDDAKANHIAEKLGGILYATEPTIPQEIIDFGLEDGTLTEEDIDYINYYRISPR